MGAKDQTRLKIEQMEADREERRRAMVEVRIQGSSAASYYRLLATHILRACS
jgi:hypothetical protein